MMFDVRSVSMDVKRELMFHVRIVSMGVKRWLCRRVVVPTQTYGADTWGMRMDGRHKLY